MSESTTLRTDILTARGRRVATTFLAILAAVFAITYLQGAVFTPRGTVLSAALVIATALAAGWVWQFLTAHGERYSYLGALAAGVALVPIANLIAWSLISIALKLVGSLTEGATSDDAPTISNMLAIAMHTTVLTAPFTFPLSILGMLAVTYWCNKQIDASHPHGGGAS